jgi:hypothetical protein
MQSSRHDRGPDSRSLGDGGFAGRLLHNAPRNFPFTLMSGRNIHRTVSTTQATATSFVADHKSADGKQSIRSESFDGQKTTTDADAVGVTSTVEGRAPQNEEGILETANALVAKLRSLGQDWAKVHVVDDRNVDCRAVSDAKPEVHLDMQVVRIPNSAFGWADLGRTGTASRSSTVAEAADGILAAVQAKIKNYGPVQQGVLLAIDARLTTAFTLDLVVREFRLRLALDPTISLFRSVWLVGPTDDMVFELSPPAQASGAI